MSRKLKRKPWDPQEDQIVGTKTDREIAAILNRSIASVYGRRRELGRPVVPAPNHKAWNSSEEGLLGKLPDEEVAKLIGRTPCAVTNWRNLLHIPLRNPTHPKWTAEEDKL